MVMQTIERDSILFSKERNLFPESFRINVAAAPDRGAFDADVIVASHGQAREAAMVIENVRLLEGSARIHFIVVETARGVMRATRPRADNDVTVLVLDCDVPVTSRYSGNRLYASFGLALDVALACRFRRSQRQLVLHTDMMGYRRGWVSYLLAYLGHGYRIASMTQRHVMPFTAGMAFDAEHFESLGIDWLPSERSDLQAVPALHALESRIAALSWLDCGERLPLSALANSERCLILPSRGGTGDAWKHPLADLKPPVIPADVVVPGLEMAPESTTEERFRKEYPELMQGPQAYWRRSFDHEGRVLFLHRGRGTSSRRGRKDTRGDFWAFMRAHGQRLRSSCAVS